MPDETINQPDVPEVANSLVAAANEWARGRKPAALCLELFVRVMQALTAIERLSKQHGVDLDGIPTDGILSHPEIPYAVWARRVAPAPQEETNVRPQ